uniref:Arf-GAP domain-containing protein n=1 Tax=Chromulina nebulosa TaxID=96789 RepID=A0A7S0SYY2_9STRA|mmetsp:Transcript_5283/g.4756  ORF Transcript_5283/g.4756 Transcript_5283/m.4756 type:complete len:411 (+) Transcript_5283:64-1296(+)|eukprot:CAMPEP_0196764784 /NCGR_PEP_ID=MMETSP1095-20130614/6852_1 /TAXON_ID=96789 ORGANISM="Chromulina nebulosa, Strain UTEXLB2642" /NCGR_SAMPLE_ID=MMETSP1095 /ASSEMBLY_ACC=CAM_ASM_000446 /LENGTH=410 /DNA_ID=CAMNT_0042121223 /DNA_START=62 /DNA_END=1294 /DNA_ORIENTATION=-
MALCLDKSVETKLRDLEGNNICVDCDSRHPQWASVSFGVFMCLDCSGKHRALGVHISFVRSVSMDSWNDKQIQSMFQGGNKKLNDFLSQYNIAKNTPIPIKYNAPASKLYKDRLSAMLEGRPLPTELPKVDSNQSIAQTSEALPGESEADYVLRQKQLQEEARERLRQKFGSSSGLRSSGKMQGIGSDASYNPNNQNNNLALADVSQKAISVLSSSIAIFGEQVSRAKAAYIDPLAKPKDSNSYSQSDGRVDQANEGGWSSISNTAVNIWQTASNVTLETVSKLSKGVLDDNDENDLRFPRTAGSLGSSKKMEGLSSNELNRYKNQEINIEDVKSDNNIDDLFDRSNSRSSPVIKRNLSNNLANYTPENQTNDLSNTKLSTNSAVNSQSSSKKKTVVSPTGDDFFATFGV